MACEVLCYVEATPTLRKGAVLAVKDDVDGQPWPWSDREKTGPFIRVRINDANAVDVAPYLVDYRTGPEGSKELVNKRLYYVESTAVDTINSGGKYLATTFASFQNFMRNIVDNG